MDVTPRISLSKNSNRFFLFTNFPENALTYGELVSHAETSLKLTIERTSTDLDHNKPIILSQNGRFNQSDYQVDNRGYR